jgi:small GTP-binding protein
VVSAKVCLLGDFAVGKTSLVRRFVYNLFDDRYISTIGVRVSRKSVVLSRDGETTELTMLLWDLAGSEEFDHMRSSYLRGTAGAVWVCDLTRPETLDSLRTYTDALSAVSPGAQLVLAGNKCDLIDQRRVTHAEVEELAARFGASHYLTSARTGEQVDALFRHLGQLLFPRPGP